MATIKIRGIGLKEIPYQKAVNLKQKIDNGELNNEWISIDNLSFKSGDITAITTDKVEVSQDKNENKKIDNEYYEDRHKILTSTPEERSNRLAFFKLFVKIMDDREVSEEELIKAKKIQLEFFEKNPYRLESNLEEFKSFVGRSAKLGRFLHIVERVINTDMFYEKYKLCNPVIK